MRGFQTDYYKDQSNLTFSYSFACFESSTESIGL